MTRWAWPAPGLAPDQEGKDSTPIAIARQGQ